MGVRILLRPEGPVMTQAAPFAVDGPLAPPLARLLAYWEGLKRGQAEVPFWDDLSEIKIEASGAETFILDVFSRPERFRFNDLEVAPPAVQSDLLLGLFLDDVDLPEVFTLLRAQASATVELMRPTLYAAGGGQRLLLPAWGEGEVRMLVGGLAKG
jgi:hypothetical protein